MEFDDAAALQLEYMARQDARDQAAYDWFNGTALGGPNGDGHYPWPAGPGTMRLVPCIERLRVDAARFGVRFFGGAGPFTMVAADVGKLIRIGNGSNTPNINVRLPNLPEGSQFMFFQEGSARLLFSAINGGSVIHRQDYKRTAGLYAMATAVCDLVTSGVSRWVLGGDMVN
ncbi:hypothetical protein [Sphingomonas sp. Ag1]|jgi:hypothetical protein|uniref:hypothetical protein n=1 Tax=Sphingomonas sp. Ag1 TaxID=1642949 RepID=UPI0006216CDC|nr:hypothetical protein [Sphingomonas sp. Ag1]KKI17503.1 hypothetical protein XM50_14445 [Sphingomonas sp. Ag1]